VFEVTTARSAERRKKVWCLHCQKKHNRDSKFCSPACREEFAKTMCEALACFECDAQIDGIATAAAAGWKDIEPDPEGTTWNYLGLCPDCHDY
jgi:hypothetical protein